MSSYVTVDLVNKRSFLICWIRILTWLLSLDIYMDSDIKVFMFQYYIHVSRPFS